MSARVLALLLGLAALGVLARLLSVMYSRTVATWVAALALFGTFLFWSLAVEPAPRPAGWLLLASLGVLAWGQAPARPAAHVALVVGSGLCALFAGPWAAPTAGALLPALFSSQGGLFFWSPVLWLGILGTALLARRHPRHAAALGAASLTFVLLAGSTTGARTSPADPRFAPLLAFLAPGLGAALDALARLARRRPGLVLALPGSLAVLSNLLFMQQYREGMVPRDDTVSFPQMAEGSARLVSDTVGTPVAWPANALFAHRHGLPVGRTDLLLGADLKGAAIDIGALEQDAAVLFEGWSVRRACAPEVCREVEGRARLLAPLGAPETLDVGVRAAGVGELTVELNGVPIAREALTPDLRVLAVRVTAARFRAPLNEIVLVVSPGGRALVDRLIFSRPEP